MKNLALLAVLSLVISGYAASAAEAPAPAPVAPAPSLTFTLSPAEVDQIGNALAAQPYKDVAALLDKLRNQVAAQQHKEQIEEKQKERTPKTPAAKEGKP